MYSFWRTDKILMGLSLAHTFAVRVLGRRTVMMTPQAAGQVMVPRMSLENISARRAKCSSLHA